MCACLMTVVDSSDDVTDRFDQRPAAIRSCARWVHGRFDVEGLAPATNGLSPRHSSLNARN